jgi:hypothetical protein
VFFDESIQDIHIESQRTTELDLGKDPHPGPFVDGVYLYAQI